MPSTASARIGFAIIFLSNQGGTSKATLTIPAQTSTSPLRTTVMAKAPGSSGSFVAQPVIGTYVSPKESRIVVPPQILLQMMNNEAGSLPGSTLRPLLGWSMRNRFSDSQYFAGQTTYQAAITAGATHSNLATGKQPELDAAASVFDGFDDVSFGSQGFWSPTNTQWMTVNQALNSGTTTLPTNVGIPFNYNGHNERTQIVYFSSVGLNTRPGRENAPAFLFVRKRNPNANPPSPAVVRLD